jgi:hypothetical protein
MRTYSSKTLIVRLALVPVLGFSSAVAQAQLSDFPEFFQKHFRYEASDTQNDPKLRTQLDYKADDTLITHSSANFNNDGFEYDMAVGSVLKFGTAQTRVTYHLHRYDYTSEENQSNDVSLDFHYRALRVQHRIEDTAQVSTIGLPFDLSAAHLNLSFSETLQQGLADPIDVYKFESRVNHLAFSATWKDSGADTSADFSTEYRPSSCWLMKYTYTDNGTALQRQFSSEYTDRHYRVAGEYMSQTDVGAQTHIAGAIYIEKHTKLAALKLSLEYNNAIDSSTIYFKVESHDVF